MTQLVSGRSDTVKSESLASIPTPSPGMEAIDSAADVVGSKFGFDPGGVDVAREGNDPAWVMTS